MTILINLLLTVIFGYALMYLFIKYYEKRRYYYIGWVISYIVLFSLSKILGESYDYIFEPSSYADVPTWIIILFLIVIIPPFTFLIYPILQIYKWLIDVFEDLAISIMNMFVSKKRKDKYYGVDKIES